MTFLKIIRHNINFFFLSLLLNVPVLEGQPPVTTALLANFPINTLFSPDTRIYSQCYCPELDILAISVKNRIISWNGYSIKEFLCKGNAFLDINKSGELYFVTNEQFGVIKDIQKPTASLKFIEGVIPRSDLAIVSAFAMKEGIPYLKIGNNIIKYEAKSRKILVSTQESFNFIKSGNDNIYYGNPGIGIKELEPAKKVDTAFSGFFKGKTVDWLIEAGTMRIVIDSKGNVFKCNPNIEPVRIIQLPEQFRGKYSSGIIDKGMIILGSESSGMAILDTRRKEVRLLSKKDGLFDNSIRGVFLTEAGYFLIVHPKGISRLIDPGETIDLNYSAITDASISRLFENKAGPFLASGKGLYQLRRRTVVYPGNYFSKDYSLVKIKGYDGELLSNFAFGSKNFFISKDAILELRDNSLVSVKSIYKTICAYQPVFDSSLLILGMEKGWQVYRFDNGKFKSLASNLDSSIAIEAISETGAGGIVLKSQDNQLFIISTQNLNQTAGAQVKSGYIEIHSSLQGSNVKIHSDGKDLILSDEDSVCIYDEAHNSFKKLEYSANPLDENLEYEIITGNKNASSWITGRTRGNHLLLGIFLVKIEEDRVRFLKSVGLQSIEKSAINDIISSDSSIIYVTNERIVICPFETAEKKKLQLTIELKGANESFKLDNNLNSKPVRINLAHENNLVRADFYSNYPDDRNSILYRYKLEGESVIFSNWSLSQQVDFSRLPPGNYKLTVQSRSINGAAEAQLSQTFHIRLPFYIKWYMVILYLIMIFAAIIVYVRWKSYIFLKDKIKLESIVSQRTEELQNEKEQSEQLLANILPKDTADELKKKGKVSSQKYEMVTVLFSDIQGFTKIAEQMNPEALIDQLDNFYFHFDSVVEKYNIEKIKTIGDAYMCAGGIPEKNRTNPVEVVLAALEVQDYMRDLKKKNSDIWDVRIGIHTGPVIAGVIGHKKFSYDIWGDTVNTASRMESSGEASKVNISGHTYEMVKDFFICEYRGKMPVKYKGEIDMYFVKGIRPELSVDLYRVPNKTFYIHLQKLRLVDVEEFIFQTFETEAALRLHFHNNRHTMEVYSLVELLGRAEGVTEEELLMARTAALMGDIGYLSDYTNNLAGSIDFAREYLAKFKYSDNQVQQVIHLLQSRDKVNANSLLVEKIMADAASIYIGRVDFSTQAQNLYKEMQEMQAISSKEVFINLMMKKLSDHQYFTETARRLQEVSIKEQKEQLKSLFKTSE